MLNDESDNFTPWHSKTKVYFSEPYFSEAGCKIPGNFQFGNFPAALEAVRIRPSESETRLRRKTGEGWGHEGTAQGRLGSCCPSNIFETILLILTSW